MPPNRIQKSVKPVNVLRNHLYKQCNVLEDGAASARCSGVLPATEVKFYVKAAYTEVVPRARQATSVRRSWAKRDPPPGHSGRFQQRECIPPALMAFQKQGPKPTPGCPVFLLQAPHCFQGLPH